MTITKEALAARLAALTAQRDQLNADLNACIGAVQDTQFWLGYLAAPVDPVADPSQPAGQADQPQDH